MHAVFETATDQMLETRIFILEVRARCWPQFTG